MKIKEIFTNIAKTISKQIRDENNKSIITENFSTEELLSDEDYDHDITFHENIQSLILQGGSVVYETNTKIKEHLENILDQSKDLVDEVEKLEREQTILLVKREKITLQKVKKEKYYEILFEKLQEESLAFKKSYEQGQKVEIMFQSFRYNGVDGFIKDNSEEDDLVKKIQEKYIDFKILEKNDFESKDSSKILKLKELLGKCTTLIKNSRDPTKQDTIQGEFMNIYNDVNKIILEAFPVKSIINFSTNVKPPDEGGSSRETYTAGINYEQNTDKILKTKFTKNNVNMLDKAGQTPENDDDNKEGKLKGELGNTLVMIKSKDKGKTYGPFYKILHTSNKDKDNKQYDVTEDLDRFFDPKDNLDHITYAGYGFSGSGKTYTLIEGEGESYNSIVNQISDYISKRVENNNITIKIYERYEEIIDDGCTDLVKSIIKRRKVFNTIKLQKDVKIKIKGLAETIKNINKDREKENELASTQLYRTSIRRTTFNPESSRSHLFVDITFYVGDKKKKITVMDMAGSEKVNVIQKDYFESVEKHKVDTDLFQKKVDILSTNFPKIKSYSDTNKIGNTYPINLITNAINAINKELIIKGGKDNYIIPIKWQELFFGTPVRNEKDKNILTHSVDPNKRKHSVSFNQGWPVPASTSGFGSNRYDPLDTSSDEDETTDDEDETTDDVEETTDDVWNEHQDFVNNYNDNQFTAKYKLLLDFNDALKKLEEVNKLNRTSDPVKLIQVKKNNREKEIFFPYTNFIEFKVIEDSLIDLFTACGLPTNIIVNNFNKIMNQFNDLAVKDGADPEHYDPTNYGGIFASSGRSLCVKVITFMGIIEDKINELDRMFNLKKDNLKSNIHYQKNEIVKKISKSSPGYTIKSLFNGDTAVVDIIKKAYNTKEKWDRTMITKYHCPLRFQGNAIMRSISQFKKNLQQLNKEKVNFEPGDEKFPYYIKEWKGTGLKNKNFVIFTNIRLDFTSTLCGDPRYLPICNAYDDSLQFSHDLLYSEQQNVDPNYKEEVIKLFNNSSSFGKKKVKKTSTRSFRKRGRRRAPSGTEIL